MKKGSMIVLGPVLICAVIYMACTGHMMAATAVTLLMMGAMDGATKYDDPHP